MAGPDMVSGPACAAVWPCRPGGLVVWNRRRLCGPV